ncbi:MAG TPA: hypothetical protein P5534_05990 [Candidatus Paceibacterota bacterium]|nr:hypothetical protein [Candidatus Paceibacterota bacterium]HRZ56257.1 hypothetical protein [Candidatus Paceibacterota bacterium]
MNTVAIQIAVSDTTADWLDRKAQGQGTDRAQIASAVLEDAAKAGPGTAGLSTQERLRRFRELADQIPARPGPPVDVSRESIYD